MKNIINKALHIIGLILVLNISFQNSYGAQPGLQLPKFHIRNVAENMVSNPQAFTTLMSVNKKYKEAIDSLDDRVPLEILRRSEEIFKRLPDNQKKQVGHKIIIEIQEKSGQENVPIHKHYIFSANPSWDLLKIMNDLRGRTIFSSNVHNTVSVSCFANHTLSEYRPFSLIDDVVFYKDGEIYPCSALSYWRDQLGGIMYDVSTANSDDVDILEAFGLGVRHPEHLNYFFPRHNLSLLLLNIHSENAFIQHVRTILLEIKDYPVFSGDREKFVTHIDYINDNTRLRDEQDVYFTAVGLTSELHIDNMLNIEKNDLQFLDIFSNLVTLFFSRIDMSVSPVLTTLTHLQDLSLWGIVGMSQQAFVNVFACTTSLTCLMLHSDSAIDQKADPFEENFLAAMYPNLLTLNIVSLPITDDSLKGLTDLTALTLFDNKLECLDLSDKTQLQRLKIYNNPLDNLDSLSPATGITYIDLQDISIMKTMKRQGTDPFGLIDELKRMFPSVERPTCGYTYEWIERD